MLTMEPGRCASRISRATACATRNMPRRLTAMIRSHSASGVAADRMIGRLAGRGEERIGVALEQGDRVVRVLVAEQADAQGRLLPRSGVAEEPDPLRGEDLLHAEGDRHRGRELERTAEVTL